jgi:hypothetical protein
MGWMTGVRFLAGAENFSLRSRVHTGSGAHPSSYPLGESGLYVKLTIYPYVFMA